MRRTPKATTSRTSCSQSHCVFTLVELMVVMAIISILMMLALPALKRAKKSSTRTSCVSNLKQIGIAVQSYEQGNMGFYPYNCTTMTGSDSDRLPLWAAINLESHKEVFGCPDENEGLFESQGSSYVWNWTQLELPGNGRVGLDKYDTAPYGGLVPPASFAILIDAGPYHGRRGQPLAYNSLYADCSVDTADRIFPFIAPNAPDEP